MFDRKRTHGTSTLNKNVTPGATIAQEGAVLVVIGSGNDETVSLSAAAPNEIIAGFSVLDNYQPTTRSVVATGTIPAAPGPYTIQLPNSNIVASQYRIYDNTTGAALAPVVGIPAPGQYQMTIATGVILFNAANANQDITVYYKYNLTVQESILLFGQRHSNAGAADFLGVCTVLGGQGELWTDQFDISLVWTIGEVAQSGANGIITHAGLGTNFGVVIHTPTTDLPWLGVRFTIANLGV